MLNQIVLVGRLYEICIIDEDKSKLTIAVPRSYKNEEGEYDTDFINCILNGAISKNTLEYCKTGDVIGIKGRVESYKDKSIMIIAEKVTFLSSNKEEKESK